MIWLKFAAIQLAMLAATVAGWLILLPVCIDKRWGLQRFPDKSLKDGRPIDTFNSALLGFIYNNPEDGVSGQQARIWDQYGTLQPYMPGAPAWWRAYCWSAWRNSCDNLKYVFADPKGPLIEFSFRGRTAKIGWQPENGFNVPVFSL